MSVAETLKLARANLVTRGWAQGTAGVGIIGGPVCAAMAICRLAVGREGERDAIFALRRAIAECGGVSWRDVSVVSWNDVPGRTVDDVLAVYDIAIAHEQAEP